MRSTIASAISRSSQRWHFSSIAKVAADLRRSFEPITFDCKHESTQIKRCALRKITRHLSYRLHDVIDLRHDASSIISAEFIADRESSLVRVAMHDTAHVRR